MLESRSRALAPAEAGLLTLLLGSYLTMLTGELMMCALYPALAVRFGAPLETVVLLTTPRSLAQLGALVLGPLSDRLGRPAILAGGLVLMAIAGWGGAVAGDLGVLAVMQVLFGLGFAIGMAVVPAIVSDRYPYAIRGRMLAIVRLAMPLALILVVPGLVGLGARLGVAAPFVVLGSAAALLLPLVAWRLPRTVDRPGAQAREGTPASSWVQPRLLALLGLVLLLSIVPSAVFGFLPAWIGQTFGDPGHTVALALASDGVGALLGVTAGALLVDRLTKRRAAVVGLAGGAAFLILLPATRAAFALALPAIAAFSGAIEVSLIALMALLGEQAPQARGTVLGLFTVALALGAAISPLLARMLWRAWSMAGIGGAGGALLFAIAITLALVAAEPGVKDAAGPQVGSA